MQCLACWLVGGTLTQVALAHFKTEPPLTVQYAASFFLMHMCVLICPRCIAVYSSPLQWEQWTQCVEEL